MFILTLIEKKIGGARNVPVSQTPTVNSLTKKVTHLRDEHNGDGNFHCNLCNKHFKILKFLKEHVKNCHESPKNVRCNLCGITYSSKKL